MDRIEPKDLLGLLHRFDRKIDNHRLIVTANDHAFERFASAGIDLLVRHERRYIDEIAGTGFGYELQPFSPAHAGFAAHHVNDTLKLPVMMGAGLGVGLNGHCAGPSPCLLMPERTSRPAQYRREAGQGLAALRNFNSAYVADGSDYDLAFWALMSALTSCGHSVARTCASVPLHLARFALPEPAVRRECRSGITPYGSDRSKGPSRASPPARSED